MQCTLYEIDKLRANKESYIYQFVSGRTLTPVYHSHDFFEIIYMLSGSAVQLINKAEISMCAGDMIVLRPFDSHSFLSQSDDVSLISLSVRDREFLLFCAAFDPTLAERIKAEEIPSPVSGADISPLIPLDKLSDSSSPHINNRYKYLLSLLLEQYTESEAENKSISPLDLSIEKMRSAESLRRGIAALTEYSHYSKSHLARLIKQRYGVSLKHYVNELRLAEAYSRIILSSAPPEDIGCEVGFSSYSHFCKIFKAKYGVTPMGLRKQNRNII